MDAEKQPTVDRWHLAIIKADDSIELLAQSYATREQAYAESLRCYSWFKLVRVGIIPARLDFNLLTVTHDPITSREAEA